MRLDPITTFKLARADAIEAYAFLEYDLCRMLAYLLGVSREAAGATFYRMTASRSRSGTLDDLFRKKLGANHRLFWNSIIKMLSQLDQSRNEIVHWTIGVEWLGDKKSGWTRRVYLVHPNSGDSPDRKEWSLAALLGFSDHCHTVSLALKFFQFCLEEPLQPGTDAHRTWHDIFQKPLEYPLPDTHPLAQIAAALPSPPEPSLA